MVMLHHILTLAALFLVNVTFCADVSSAISAAVSTIHTGTANDCCAALSLALSSRVSYPGDPAYIQSLGSYFSQQESHVLPDCIVSPTSSKNVSVAIGILSRLNAGRHNNPACNFAVRSGGHTPFAGSANIESGVTIDLSALDVVAVSADHTITSVGPGARWKDVYIKLDAMGLAVSGGRAAQVGVGGLSLGGGLSYFSPSEGFVCDNVENFQVVLADGRVVNANIEENADLLHALRGGSNNFGVITRLDLRTFKQGQLWGGVVYYDSSTATQQLEALFDFANDTNYDEYASIILSFGYAAGKGSAIVNNLEYIKPVINPTVFQPFTAIQPQLASTARITSLTDIATEQGAFQVNGERQLSVTTTFKTDLAQLSATVSLWNASVEQIRNVPGVSWSLSFEPIPPAITSKTAALGGDSLGLDPADGSLILTLLSASWLNSTDDNAVISTAKTLFYGIDESSKSKNAFNRFKYLNYAAYFQDPIGGYGPTEKTKLQAASKKYDPYGVFQRAVPGGFKLFT